MQISIVALLVSATTAQYYNYYAEASSEADAAHTYEYYAA